MAAPLLEWTEDYRIGVPSLDFEHQDLFARTSELHEELARQEEKAKIEACLGGICARLEAHFALEEHFMREHAHPLYREHKAEHDRFLDDFEDLIAAFFRDAGPDLGVRLENMLSTWIPHHVLIHDRKLSLFVERDGVAPGPLERP